MNSSLADLSKAVGLLGKALDAAGNPQKLADLIVDTFVIPKIKKAVKSVEFPPDISFFSLFFSKSENKTMHNIFKHSSYNSPSGYLRLINKVIYGS
jgi:hypothetical protein